MNDQELREQCRKEAEAKYPAPPYEPMPEGLDEIFAPDVRYTKQFAYAEALFAERKSNRELVQALVDALDAEIFWSSWLPMNAMDDADQSECIADGKRSNEALALASSKGFTPTQR